MSKAEMRQFARIYFREFRRDYPDIYADDAAWCAWTRMLIASEEAWPAMPELPRSVRPRALRTLTDRGLVKVAGTSFVLKGWVADRSLRAKAGKAGAVGRWDANAMRTHSDGNANGDANAMQRRSRGRDRDEEAKRGVIATDARATPGPVQPLRETA